MTPEDSQLKRLKEGDSAAFDWLVGQFEGPLFRFFVCDHRDYHLAQEQTSETFVQLVRSLPTMKGKHEQLRAFVFAIARHVKMREWRRPQLQSYSLGIDEEICDPRPSPAMQADDHEQIQRLMKMISQFEPTVRDVLLFRFVEGCSIDEVARALDLPEGTVKSHIHRGVARLKKIFSDSGCQK